MSLTEKISSDLINAMKAKDKVVLEAIRAAKTAFTLARTEKSGDTILTADEELKIIQKLVKQRRESAAIYKEQNRPDLYEKEITEAEVLEKYLPAKMSDEELLNTIKGIISRVGAKSPADMGKVMGVATKELAGKADGKEISAKVKQILGSLSIFIQYIFANENFQIAFNHNSYSYCRRKNLRTTKRLLQVPCNSW